MERWADWQVKKRRSRLWWWMQSSANPPLPKIPVNREKYREFCRAERSYLVYPQQTLELNGFQNEIVTGNEQGNTGGRTGKVHHRTGNLILLRFALSFLARPLHCNAVYT
jgi:hypothetical protein